MQQDSELAVVTGASTGIGFELAKCCVEHGMCVLIAADEARIHQAAAELRSLGGTVEALEVDLATLEGVDRLMASLGDRKVSAILANAGRGLGRSFLDQDFADIRRVVDTNITGTLYLLHQVARRMSAAGSGRILITGSIAGFMPGTYQAVYNGTKAFLDSFAYALRAELNESGVSVTCLMPGATDTDFFERADMQDTKVATGRKESASDVARAGFKAMIDGEGEVITGWQNKLRAAIASIAPAGLLSEQHRRMAAPGSG